MAVNGHAKFSLVSIMPVRANDGAEMFIRHPVTFDLMRNADDTPASITIRGQSSRAFRDTVLAMNRKRAATRMTDDEVRSQEHIYDTDTELLVACTVGWNFDELAPDEPLPYSEENARALWTDDRFSNLRFQAIQFMLNNGNFLPVPPALSSAMPDTSSVSTSPSPDRLAAE
jgi:hypothetical protein